MPRKPDYTGVELEWSDPDFQLRIPTLNGSLFIGIYTVKVTLVGIGDELFEPREMFTIVNNEDPDEVRSIRWTEYRGAHKDMIDLFSDHVTMKINHRMDEIREWCVGEAARQGLDEPDHDARRDLQAAE